MWTKHAKNSNYSSEQSEVITQDSHIPPEIPFFWAQALWLLPTTFYTRHHIPYSHTQQPNMEYMVKGTRLLLAG